MKISCILTVIVLVLATICDPTKAAPQGWIWEDEAIPSTPTQRPAPTPAPNPNDFRSCMRTCPATAEFNPVCGSDGITYGNEGKLKCARKCGAGDIKVAFMASCNI